jgi:hypothetical protein
VEAGKLSQANLNRYIETDIVERLRKVERLTRAIKPKDPSMERDSDRLNTAAIEWRMALQLLLEAGKAKDGSERDRLLKLAGLHNAKSDAAIRSLSK